MSEGLVMGREGAAGAERGVFPQALPPGLKPHLRLFLSVDVVGSTVLKQARAGWRPAMLSFYRDFDYIIYEQFKAASARSNRTLATPEFWKSNGDELLYTCELKTVEQAHDAIHIWLAALEQYRDETLKPAERLEVKSTAWIGLFPLPNTEVFFRRASTAYRADEPRDPVLAQAQLRDEFYASGGRTDITRDFVGPSIDQGFRLTHWASPRRMIMSVDLAFLLTSAYTWGKDGLSQPLPLHHTTGEGFRHVLGEESYPAIWAPVGGEAPDARAGQDLADPETLRNYCEAVIERNHRTVTPLCLSDDEEGEAFDWLPPYLIRQILAEWQAEVAHRAEAMR
jgi:hypothetical protein